MEGVSSPIRRIEMHQKTKREEKKPKKKVGEVLNPPNIEEYDNGGGAVNNVTDFNNLRESFRNNAMGAVSQFSSSQTRTDNRSCGAGFDGITDYLGCSEDRPDCCAYWICGSVFAVVLTLIVNSETEGFTKF